VRHHDPGDTGVEHLLDHPFVEFAAIGGQTRDDRLDRSSALRGECGGIQEVPEEPLEQAEVVGLVLEVAEEEVEVGVVPRRDGGLVVGADTVVIDPQREDRLVRLQQLDQRTAAPGRGGIGHTYASPSARRGCGSG
jgi:hypothetical protein